MNDKKSLEMFSEAPVHKAVLNNALPAMLAMLMVLVYNLADTFFIGQTHDALQVAAVSIATPIFLIFMAVGTIFGVGGTSVISRAMGEGRNEYAKKVSSFCMWSSVVIGVLLAAVMLIFTDPILSLVGASSETSGYAGLYLRIVACCGPFVLISNCYSNVVRAEGESGKAVMGQLIGNLLNVILDPVFILVFGWDIAGAAIATVIGNVFGAVYYIVYLVKESHSLSIKLKDLTVKEGVAKNVFAIGIPAALGTLLMSVSQIIINSQMAEYGDMAIAAMGVAMKVVMITAMVSMGIGQGVQALLGYCVGAKLWDRFKSALRFSMIFALGLSVALTGLCYIFTDQIVSAFLTDAAAFDYAVTFARILLCTSFLMGILYVLTNALQAMGAATEALVINVSRQGIVFIPAVYILKALLGITGVIWAQPVADFVSLFVTVVLYVRTSKKMMGAKTDAGINADVYLSKNDAETPEAAADHSGAEPLTDHIITIGRSYGAGGRTVGKLVAKKLHIPYYDVELLKMMAEEQGIDLKYLQHVDEKPIESSNLYPPYASGIKSVSETAEYAYAAQKEIIKRVAQEGPCVIVGRCADIILEDHKELFRVFITGNQDSRSRRVANRENLDLDEGKRKVSKVDKERAAYYNQHGKGKWGTADHYDLILNTDWYSLEKCADIITCSLTVTAQ